MPAKNRNVLILYENTGAGHKRVAQIIASIIADERCSQITTQACSDFFGDASAKAVNYVWNSLIRANWNWLADLLVNSMLRTWVLPIMDVTADKHFQKLDEFSPDIVICTIDGWNKFLGTWCKRNDVPFYIVLTEVSVFQDIVNPWATHICYFPETVNLIRSFSFEETYFTVQIDETTSLWQRAKYVVRVYRDHIWHRKTNSVYRNIGIKHPEINNAKCMAVGPIVGEEFGIVLDKTVVKEELNIDDSVPCVLVISGSIGGQFVRRVVDTIIRGCHEAMTVIAVCGHDKRAHQQLSGLQQSTNNIELRVFGYVDNLCEFYSAVDLVVARPSSSVLFEAVSKRRPILLPAQTTSNDQGNVAIAVKRGWGKTFESLSEIPSVVDAFCKSPTSFPNPEVPRFKKTIQAIFDND